MLLTIAVFPFYVRTFPRLRVNYWFPSNTKILHTLPPRVWPVILRDFSRCFPLRMQANIVVAFCHKFTATKKGERKKRKQWLKKAGNHCIFEKRGISVVILKKVAANTIRVIFEIFELYKQVNLPSGGPWVAIPNGNVFVWRIIACVPWIDEVFTLKSPNFPFLTASLSLSRTNFSVTLELNISLRSTIKLPHLKFKKVKV